VSLSGGFGLHGHAHNLALFGLCDRLDPTRAALVFLNACQTMLGETLAPPSHLGLVLPEFRSDLLIGFAFAGKKDDPRTDPQFRRDVGRFAIPHKLVAHRRLQHDGNGNSHDGESLHH
jgi:hypothetical protein